MPTCYAIRNTTSGAFLGLYNAADADEAMQQLMVDAAHDGGPADDLEAVEVTRTAATDTAGQIAEIQAMLGNVATKADAEAMYEQGDNDGNGVWFVWSWDRALEAI